MSVVAQTFDIFRTGEECIDTLTLFMRVNLCSRKHKRCFNWKRTSKDYTNFNTILTNLLYEIKYALIIYPSPCCEEFTTEINN